MTGPTRSAGARRYVSRHFSTKTAIVCLLLAGILASCSSSATAPSTSKAVKPVQGGTVSFAEPPATTPSWILPFVDTTDYSYFTDFDWDWQMWRPVYFVGTPTSPDIDYSESLANKPVFSNNDTTVSVTLKPWKWSDGTPITARNVLFFFNILKVEKLNWWLYIPGSFPDDVKSAKVTSERTIQFQLIHAYNPELISQNDLQSLTPLPLAWDRTSLSGPRGAGSTLPAGTGNGLDMTPAGARRVYAFLISQNKDLAAYSTNWLWKIVDGPFKLSTYSITGMTSLVPNREYGGVQAKISRLTFLPFTSASSEFAALRSGQSIDVGYTSTSYLNQQSALTGYTLAAWPAWAFSDWFINFNNPTAGPAFRQLYIREAMQSLIDQPTIDKYVYKGYAEPSLGSVPLYPPNSWLSSYEKSYPYPYKPALAVKLLSSHGWAVHPSGVTTCTRPGTGSSDCGAGIAAGTGLTFQLSYSNGLPTNQTQALVEKGDFSKAGIVINLRPVTPAELFSLSPTCAPSQSACSWQLMSYQDYTPFPYPFGGIDFETGGVYNFGSYSDPTTDKLLAEAKVASTPSGLSKSFIGSENRILQQLSELFQPTTPYQLTEVLSNLHGVTPQSPELAITPELWYFTK